MTVARREGPEAMASAQPRTPAARHPRSIELLLHSPLCGVRLLTLVLLAAMFGACTRAEPATPDPLPAYLRLVPCGGTAQLQESGSSEWAQLNTQIEVDGELRVRAEGDRNARLCPADGSLLELMPGSVVDLRPAEDGSLLAISVREGSVRLLAQKPSYQLGTSGCPVGVTEVPARIQVERSGATTRVLVEQGSAVCADASEPILLTTCWELMVEPDEAPQVAQTCGAVAEASPTGTAVPTTAATESAAPTPTSAVGADASPTGEPAPETASPSPPPATAAPTATPEPTSTPEATSTPPPTATPVPTSTPEPSPIP